MALRKPLVIVSGQIQQLQSSDQLDGVDQDIVTLTNENVGSVIIGAPVYSVNTANADKAQADAAATARVIGLVLETTIASNASGRIQTDGIMSATTGQWDAVGSGTGAGLEAGTVYYLDPDTAGNIVNAATTTVTELVTQVGIGLSTTQMEITIEPPILL